MKAVLIELFKKLVVYFLFITIVFVVTYSVITGEFPPKISKIKSSVTDFKTQITQIKKLQQAASERLLNQDLNIDSQIEVSNQANEHYLKIYNELQSIKGQLGNIENRIYRIEQSGLKESQRPYPVIK